jgi:hypothetical protein
MTNGDMWHSHIVPCFSVPSGTERMHQRQTKVARFLAKANDAPLLAVR